MHHGSISTCVSSTSYSFHVATCVRRDKSINADPKPWTPSTPVTFATHALGGCRHSVNHRTPGIGKKGQHYNRSNSAGPKFDSVLLSLSFMSRCILYFRVFHCIACLLRFVETLLNTLKEHLTAMIGNKSQLWVGFAPTSPKIHNWPSFCPFCPIRCPRICAKRSSQGNRYCHYRSGLKVNSLFNFSSGALRSNQA